MQLLQDSNHLSKTKETIRISDEKFVLFSRKEETRNHPIQPTSISQFQQPTADTSISQKKVPEIEPKRAQTQSMVQRKNIKKINENIKCLSKQIKAEAPLKKLSLPKIQMQDYSKSMPKLKPLFSESSQRSSANLSSLCQNYNVRVQKNFAYLNQNTDNEE